MQGFIDTKQASLVMGIGLSRIYHLIKQGRLQAQKFGRDWMILEADARAYKPNKVGRPKNLTQP